MNVDRDFGASIAEVYERLLVPLIFEPYANVIADRVARHPVSRVLELAAGTGVVTRALASHLPQSVHITATDLNQPMIDRAVAVGTTRAIEWKQADALNLPFENASFDAVVCQFGVMFFTDKVRAFSEARRVLRPGGLFLFSVWDRIEENEFADSITRALGSEFPEESALFLRRTPHGYCDQQAITADLHRAGFGVAEIVTVAARSRADSAAIPAMAYCQGTPLRNEIESVDPGSLDSATEIARRAIENRFGRGPVEGKLQALVVSVMNTGSPA